MVAKERFDRVALIALVTPLQHGAQGPAGMARRARGQRKEREQGRAREVPRQEEAAGAGACERGIGRTGRFEVAGEGLAAPERGLLVGGPVRVKA